jgi:hypothetical protein
MRTRSVALLFAAAVLTQALVPRAAPAQEPSPPRVFSETLDVRVVNVETVVTDRDGRPVRGLSAEDFRLRVDGREVPIEFFTEVADGTTAEEKAGAPAAPIPAGEAVWRNYLVLSQLGKTAKALSGALRGFEAPPGRKVLLLLSAGWSLHVDGAAFGPFVADANRLGYTVYPVDVATQDPVSLKAFDHLAAKTGGRVASSPGSSAFHAVVADSGSYYWIGFTPDWKSNDRHHQVEVEVRRAGLQARARAGFSDLSERTASAMKAESVLLFGGEESAQRLIVQIGELRAAGRRKVEVPVTLGVPVEALALKPDGKGYLAETALAVASIDDGGERAELPTLRLQVKIQQVPPAGTYARFQTTVKLRRAGQRLVFTVHDAVTGSVMWGEAEVAP